MHSKEVFLGVDEKEITRWKHEMLTKKIELWENFQGHIMQQSEEFDIEPEKKA